MFSVRIVTADHYISAPLPGLDVSYSDFRGSEARRVPVIRIFGATPAGQKTCLHLHGIFPYIYVPYDGSEPVDRYLRQFASSVDRAIQVAVGKGSSTVQHVFKVSLVSGIPYYGYHTREQDFMKIYFYNPLMVKKAVDLLHGGAVMNKVFQPYEAHVPYLLQVFMDYNLYGMNLINLGAVKFRRPKEDDAKEDAKPDHTSSQGSHSNQTLNSPTTPTLRSAASDSSINSISQQYWDAENLPSSQLLDGEVARQSVCELEVDAVAADILNRSEIESNVGTNPGLVAMWEDEKQRRREQGESSQISPPLSPERDESPLTDTEEVYQQRINAIIEGYENLLQSRVENEDSFGLSEDTLLLSHDQEDSPLSSPGGSLNRTPSSFVELHYSQSKSKEMDEESEDEPVVDEEAVQNVLEVSQSFRLSQMSTPVSGKSTPKGPLLDSQDQELIDILEELANEGATERSILSGLSQRSGDSEDVPENIQVKECEDDDEAEDAVMSQAWIDEDEVEEADGSPVARKQDLESDREKEESDKEYDLEGMDLSWSSSHWEDVIPQVDGGADDKPDNTAVPARKTLGLTRRIVHKPKQESAEGMEGPPKEDNAIHNEVEKCENMDMLNDVPGNASPVKEYHVMESVERTGNSVALNLCNDTQTVMNSSETMEVESPLKNSQPTTSNSELKRQSSCPSSSTFQSVSMATPTPNYFLSTPTKDDMLSLESMLSNIRRSASKMTRTIPSLDLAPAVASKPPINKNPHQPSRRMQQKRAKLSRRRQLNADFPQKASQQGIPTLNSALPLAVPLMQTQTQQQGLFHHQKFVPTNCSPPIAGVSTASSCAGTKPKDKVKRDSQQGEDNDDNSEEEEIPLRRVTRRRSTSKVSIASTLRRKLSITSESSMDCGELNEESDTDYHEDEDDEEDDDFVIETRMTRSRRKIRRKTSDSKTESKPYTLRTKRRRISYNEPTGTEIKDDASVTSAKSEKSDRSSGRQRKRKKEILPVHYIIINKFKGYKSMRVLVNRVSNSSRVKVTQKLLDGIERAFQKEKRRVEPKSDKKDELNTSRTSRSSPQSPRRGKPSQKRTEKGNVEGKDSEKVEPCRDEEEADEDVFPRRQKPLLVKQYRGKFPETEKIKAQVAVLDRCESDEGSDSSLTGEPVRKRGRKGKKTEPNEKRHSALKSDATTAKGKSDDCDTVVNKNKEDIQKESKDSVRGKRIIKSTATKRLSRRQSRRNTLQRTEPMFEDNNDDSSAPFIDAMWTLAYYSPCNSDSGEMSPPRAWSPTVKSRVPLTKKKGKTTGKNTKGKSKSARSPRKTGASPRRGEEEDTNSLLSDLREVMYNLDKDSMMKEIESFEKIPSETFEENISESIGKIDYIDSIIKDCSSTNSLDSSGSLPKGKTGKGKKKQGKGASSTSGGPLLCTTPPATSCAGVDQQPYRPGPAGAVPMDPMYMTSANSEQQGQGYASTSPRMPDDYRKPPPPYRPPRQGSGFEKFASGAGFSQGSQFQQFAPTTTAASAENTFQPQGSGTFPQPPGSAYHQQDYQRQRPEPLHMPVPQNNQVQYDLMSPPYVESDPNGTFGAQGNFSDFSQYRDKTHLAPTTPTPSVGQPSPNYTFNQQGMPNSFVPGQGDGYKYMGSQQNNTPMQVGYGRSQSYNQSEMYTQSSGVMPSNKGYQQSGVPKPSLYPIPASRTLSRSMSEPYGTSANVMPMSYGDSYPTVAKPSPQQPLPSSMPDKNWLTQGEDAGKSGNGEKTKKRKKQPKSEQTTKTKAAGKTSTKSKKDKKAEGEESKEMSRSSSRTSNASDSTADGDSRRNSSDIDTQLTLTSAETGPIGDSPEVSPQDADNQMSISPTPCFTPINSSSGSDNQQGLSKENEKVNENLTSDKDRSEMPQSVQSQRSPPVDSVEQSTGHDKSGEAWDVNCRSSQQVSESDLLGDDGGNSWNSSQECPTLKRGDSTENLTLRLDTDSESESETSCEKTDARTNAGREPSTLTPEKANGDVLSNGNSPRTPKDSPPEGINNLPRSQEATSNSEKLNDSSFSLQPGQQPHEESMDLSPSSLQSNSQNSNKSGDSSQENNSEHNLCQNSVKIWTPLEIPPAKEKVKDNLNEFGLPGVRHKAAFYSNPDDLPEKTSEVGGKQLKLYSVLPSELPDFDSRLSQEGLRHWKTMLAVSQGSQMPSSDFNVISEIDRNPQMKAAFMGDQDVILAPSKDPPSREKVVAWLRGKQSKSVKILPGQRDAKNLQIVSERCDMSKDTKATDLTFEDEPENDAEEESTLKVKNDINLSPESGKDASDDLDVISPSPEAKRRRSLVFLFGSQGNSQGSSRDRESLTQIERSKPPSPVTPETLKPAGTGRITPTQDRELAGPQHSTPTGPCRPTQLALPKCTPILSSDAVAQPAERPKLSRLESGGTKNLRRALLTSQIKNQFLTPVTRRLSDISQIEGPTPNNTYGFKVTMENLQDAKALHEVQYLTTICMELHLRTRKDLCPDPEFDPIKALFYQIHSDYPSSSGKKANITGVIIVDKDSANQNAGPDENQPSTSKATEHVRGQRLLHRSGVTDLHVNYVADEKALFEEFVTLFRKWDPDILIGYEIQMLSWGYLLQRAMVLEYHLSQQLSRIPGTKKDNRFAVGQDDYGPEHMSDIHIVGRIVLNLWRVLRHEVTLNIYTFENVAFHVLHQRFPRYSFRSLSDWFEHKTDLYRWRTIDYYVARVRGQQQIMEQLDLIGKTSELARVFGIEFYHVLSRGTQYRVESMMLRLAKPMNYIASSPSVQQRARSKAPECLPLNMEPESSFYSDPVVVLDFQSLYPSMMIAYNYCFSTCLGRVKFLEESGEIPLGCLSLNVPPGLLRRLQKRDGIHVSPNGVAFVKPKIRKGVVPKMLEDILKTRIMVKKSMKDNKDNKALHKLLHARQLGLKLIANVTYGYTSANFSGRMPCIEIGDSVVRKGRETLERAIELVRNSPKWNAEVVYGDTDSMFVLLKGRSKAEAFRIGREMASEVTALNPKPVKLKFEKVYMPCVLQTKKRYVGYSYESEDQTEPDFDAKGIETVRRDNCPAVAKILERSLKLLFNTRYISQVKQFVQRQCQKLSEGRISMQDLVFSKEYRGMGGYRPGACVPALEISKRLLAADRCAEPRAGQRVPYVIVYGSPRLPLIQLVRRPEEVLQDSNLRLNATYYIVKQILPPLDRVLAMIGVDVKSWYNELPKVIRVPSFSAQTSLRKGTISQYFNTVNCPVCGEPTKESVCISCRGNPQRVTVVLNTKIREWERTHHNLSKICCNCCGTLESPFSCVSLDCPVLYRLAKAQRDISKADNLRQLQIRMIEF